MSDENEEQEADIENDDDEGEPEIPLAPSRLKVWWKHVKERWSAWGSFVQWASVIKRAMAGVSIVLGAFIAIGYWQESLNGPGTYPGIGTAWAITPYYVMLMFVLYLATYVIVKNSLDGDMLEIYYSFPPHLQQVYDREGEDTDQTLDAEELEQQRFTGLRCKPEYIDVPDDLLVALTREGGMTKEERALLVVKINEYIKLRQKIKTAPGRASYMYWFQYKKWGYWATTDGKKKRTHPFCDALVSLPAPYAESILYTMRRVPANGFRIKHAHCDRLELTLKEILDGDFPVFIATSCGYIRQVNQQGLKPSDELLNIDITDTGFYLYNRQRSKTRPLEQRIDKLVAECDESNAALSVTTSRTMMQLLRSGQDITSMRHDLDQQKTKPITKSSDGAIIGMVIASIIGFAMFLLWLFK
jgi:hypothetical protein